MKLVMDERIKHRLIGIAVLVSIGAIFAPAIMKKSSQRFDNPATISIKLPPKPELPNVSVKDEATLFKSAKVAHVDIPTANEDFQPTSTIARAESLSPVNDKKMAQSDRRLLAGKEDANPPPVSQLVKAQPVPAIKAVPKLAQKSLASNSVIPQKKVVIMKKALAKSTVKSLSSQESKSAYAVQVALFTKQNNAVVLVNRLKNKGFKAAYYRVNGPNGVAYKVLVGENAQKDQAQKMKLKLASAMQINGFVVPTTGIS